MKRSSYSDTLALTLSGAFQIPLESRSPENSTVYPSQENSVQTTVLGRLEDDQGGSGSAGVSVGVSLVVSLVELEDSVSGRGGRHLAR